jgi:hypothetical protein
MRLPRKVRILSALVALIGMLFMQWAIASHTCAPGCDPGDSAMPSLCHVHCQDAKTSLDKAELPVLAPAPLNVGAIVVPLEVAPALAVPNAEPQSLLQRSTAPPLAIRHCCLRF